MLSANPALPTLAEPPAAGDRHGRCPTCGAAVVPTRPYLSDLYRRRFAALTQAWGRNGRRTLSEWQDKCFARLFRWPTVESIWWGDGGPVDLAVVDPVAVDPVAATRAWAGPWVLREVKLLRAVIWHEREKGIFYDASLTRLGSCAAMAPRTVKRAFFVLEEAGVLTGDPSSLAIWPEELAEWAKKPRPTDWR